VSALAEFSTEVLEIELSRRQKAGFGKSHGISVRDAVARAFDVPAFALYGRERTARVSEARFACYLLLRQRGLSHNEVAAITGRKDHGSVLHGLKRADWMQTHEPAFGDQLAAARAELASDGD